MNIRHILTGSAVIAVLAVQPMAANAAPAASADPSASVAGLALSNTTQDTVPQRQTTAPQTAADNCDWKPTRDAGNVQVLNTKEIRLRYGPASTCGFIGWNDMDLYKQLWVVCKTVNNAGSLWYYVDPAPGGLVERLDLFRERHQARVVGSELLKMVWRPQLYHRQRQRRQPSADHHGKRRGD
ncbi:hypothetical protein ACFXA3_38570 [Streptomyces sp. NPDC059456]|uniref:hypothetical protein n=1 Tax=Streptomyces sp. NPDC059456 TaxID=3346838 RepID=UPI0036C76042